MNTNNRQEIPLSDMHPRLQYLLDRQDILDCIHRYTRGLDRHDDELLRAAFHEDAVDHHGHFVGPRDEFVRWANHECHGALHAHMHNITSHTCEIDGDTAQAESYVIFVHRYKDNTTVHVGGGRYLDRLEKRDGEWRITLRRLVLDYRFTCDGSVFGEWDGYEKGRQDRGDSSYQQPLTLPPDAKAQLRSGKYLAKPLRFPGLGD